LVLVANAENPCSVMALEGQIAGHIGNVGLDEATARNILASTCQYVIDTMAVVDLLPYTFVIEEWREAPHAGGQIEMLVQDQIEGYFYHPVFETVTDQYSVFQDGRYRFGDLIYNDDPSSHILDIAFRKCMFFISSALRYPDHTASFCIHAIEAIRAAYGDGASASGRSRAWAAMHAALDSEHLSRRVSSEDHQSERHGQVISRTWRERAEVLAPTIEIAYRYGLARGN
jgi:hypothetical protein